MMFYVGLHQPSDAKHFARCCISVNRLATRRARFSAGEWMMDSGAFTEISRHGRYRASVTEYVNSASRWFDGCGLSAMVAQDYMCEPFITAKTGLSVPAHQRLTIERYDELLAHGVPVHVLPVLQGFTPADYVRHVADYGDRLRRGMWVGVGSVCKRNASPVDVANILAAIKAARPDLRLHGFGLKKTALTDSSVRAMLYSADSMAWSFSARRQGRNANDWREARAFEAQVISAAEVPSDGWQLQLAIDGAAA